MAEANAANAAPEVTPEQKPATDGNGGGAPDLKPAAEVVPKQEFEHVMGDMHRYKQSAKELAEENKRLKEAQLTQNQQWETLAKQREQERDEALAARDKTNQAFMNGEKMRAVHAAVAKLNIRPDAIRDLSLLDLKGVEIQTTSDGQLNVLGADMFAQSLKTERPYWFNQEQAPNLANGPVGITPEAGPVTTAMLVKAEREANKSGDRSVYESLHAKYRAQGRAR